MKQYLQPLEAQESTLVSPISGEEAAKTVLSASHENVEDIVGFEEAEGQRLGVKVGDTVSVTPTDTGELLISVCSSPTEMADCIVSVYEKVLFRVWAALLL